ncbi:MAG TPA: NfeD family protein [Candidatus Sulfotelmatobacter sp.]|nr:NfeD family protein [Candidatus Sulfotelmatobacter sp.]
MTWSDFYLICFAVGFCFSFFSFVFGGSRFGKLHLPHFHSHAGHLPSMHGPVAHGPGAGGHSATPGAAQASDANQPAHGASVSPFNPPSIAAFLAWFGGTGYLLTRFSAFWVGTALLFSIVSGLIGGAIIFLFLTKVLISDEECLDPADFEMVGVLGKLSVPIRERGTGELIYSQAGTRRVCGARSEDGSAIAKGTEVVVTRYEKGIAYVRLWSEMSGEMDEASTNGKEA